MTAPNIVNLQSITGVTTPFTATNTATVVVANNTSSNSVIKLNTVMLTNTTNTSIVSYLELYRNSASYPISYGITVPVGVTMVLVGKDTPIYLQEGDALRFYANTSTGLSGVTSYEVIG